MSWQVPGYSSYGSDFTCDFTDSLDENTARWRDNYLGNAELEHHAIHPARHGPAGDLMIGPPAARWLFTAVFAMAGTGAVLPLRCIAGVRQQPTGRARHANWAVAVFCPLMCAALIAMTWWSEPAAATWPQVAVFGCAAIWFTAARPSGGGRAGWKRRLSLAGLHYGLMSGSMIWMLAAMPATTAMHAAAAMPSAGAGHDTMPGTSPAATPALVVAVSIPLAAYLGLAAVPWLARALGRRPGVNGLAAVGQAVMSAGMAAMLVAML